MRSTSPKSRIQNRLIAEEHPESNIPIYESLSEEDEADIRENENTNTKPSTEGSVKPVKEEKPQKAKGQGTKRKWSKVWDTFAYIKGTSEEGDTVKCQKCGYTIPYNSSFGTGNLLKHQNTCTRSSDIRQMIISSSGGSIAMYSAKFDPMVFRDMITDAVVVTKNLDHSPSYCNAKTKEINYQPRTRQILQIL
ncbi:hypothetical protein POM88_040382 [Heracleum sosnowskyi]|uniref:BED-type domain-containing protein n=1 Tax=Heracleum sosnowskyi TaxID=360622 RepID=A0AAD8HD56_9APIA|nr:hypothetical protein POM88_040382 [Heracleum sosnowskyi]